MRKLILSFALSACLGSLSQAQLMVDFDSTTQDVTAGVFHAEPGFEFYEAGHEVAEDFVARDYTAFGGTISLAPTWPNTTDNRVQQAIDRGGQDADTVANPGSHDATWLDVSDADAGTLGLNLVTDFLGIDTRTANGGNGDWDGATGTPTTLVLTLAGLPASDYVWNSYHHDTENVHGEFEVQVSTDGGTTFSAMPNGIMSSGSEGGNPAIGTGLFGPDALVTTTAEMDAAGSIYKMGFTADGSSDVLIQFEPYAGGGVHNQIFGINGFVLDQGTIVVEPGGVACDADGDGDCQLDDIDALYAASGAAAPAAFDFSGNGTIGSEDLNGWLAAASASDNTANPDGRTLVVGDVDFSFGVTSTDLGLLLNNFGSSAASAGEGVGYGGGDLDMDGQVNSTDLGLLLNNFGSSSASAQAVPEPGTMTLLLLAGLSMLGLRKRS